jgi:hypothetical protein
MRTFADLAKEFIGMATPTLRGVITGDWRRDFDLSALLIIYSDIESAVAHLVFK